MSQGKEWRLLVDPPGEGRWNMAVDRALLNTGDPRPVLRLYRWSPPALSLGWFQPPEPFVELAKRKGLDLLRRPTGGGAIHHDDEVTFCLVAQAEGDGYPEQVVAAYEVVHEVIIHALDQLGVAVSMRGCDMPLSVDPREAGMCFAASTALDLVDEAGRKVVGSAQRRTGGRVLHHGSIPLTIPSLTPEASSVSFVAGRQVHAEELIEVLIDAFESRLCHGLKADSLSQEESESAHSLLSAVSVKTERSLRRKGEAANVTR